MNDPERYKWGTGLVVFDADGEVRSHTYVEIDKYHLITGTPLVDSAANVTLAGYTDGAIAGFTNQGGDDGVVFQLSQLGALNWAQMFGTAATDSVGGLCLGPNGDIFLSGYTGGTLFGTALGGNDAVVGRLMSSSGVPIWTRQFGGPGDEYGLAVALDKYGDVFVAGAATSALARGLTAGYGGLDAYAAKFSPSGTPQ